MVDLGRTQALNSSRTFGSSEDGFDIVRHREPQTLEFYTPPVPRNFSYPTNVSLRPRTPIYTSDPPIHKDFEGHLEESHTSPPICPPGGKAADIQGLYVVTPKQHKPSVVVEQQGQPAPCARPLKDIVYETTSRVETKPRKKQHRGALAGLSVSQLPSVTPFFKTSRAGAPSTESKISRNKRQGRIIHHAAPKPPHKEHKIAQSLDASQYILFQSTTPDRPASSSGDPHVDSRLKYSASPDPIQSLTPIDHQASNMGVSRFLHVSPTAFGQHSTENNRHQAKDLSTESSGRKTRGGKDRLLSQIKDWVSTSEPSSQALKNYKKNAYKQAGISRDDPRAPVKLHIPVATLPPEAIKPSGPGPDPEDVLLKKAEMKKKMRHSFRMFGSPRPGSRSSSQRSSLSSLHYSY
jgi:hypothetical protein